MIATDEQKLLLLRVQLFAAAQTLKGDNLVELRALLDEVSSIMPAREHAPAPAQARPEPGERVDLDDLRTLAVAAQESADYREDLGRKGMARWSVAPRRDGSNNVIIAHDGAGIFHTCELADAAFAVAAQPAVVVALLDRIQALEEALRVEPEAGWVGHGELLAQGVVLR